MGRAGSPCPPEPVMPKGVAGNVRTHLSPDSGRLASAPPMTSTCTFRFPAARGLAALPRRGGASTPCEPPAGANGAPPFPLRPLQIASLPMPPARVAPPHAPCVGGASTPCEPPAGANGAPPFPLRPLRSTSLPMPPARVAPPTPPALVGRALRASRLLAPPAPLLPPAGSVSAARGRGTRRRSRTSR